MTSESDLRLTSSGESYPILQAHNAGDIIAWRGDRPVTAHQFLQDAYALASELPESPYAINLCEDRYWFLVGFTALLINHQTNLLPPNRAPDTISEIGSEYSNVFCLCDCNQYELQIPVHRIRETLSGSFLNTFNVPQIAGQHLAAIAFTSGSTGKASPNPKYWRDLVTGARMQQKRFHFGANENQQSFVATVPPQHMYGLETSILNPLINGVSVYTDKTFFPRDICNALEVLPQHRVLVTTPVHLRSCVKADIQWPEIDSIISATAPLDKSLADLAESIFECPVLEIYGCTEAGSLASRRTIANSAWLLYEGTTLKNRPEGFYVAGPNLPEDILISDLIELDSSREFRLIGRSTDMINIAGKRASLSDLNIRLNRIEEVVDAVILAPELLDENTNKLAALVVAPSLTKDQIRRKLAKMIDPVFLPRPLYLVDQLPRNEAGKLPRAALLKMLDSLRRNH